MSDTGINKQILFELGQWVIIQCMNGVELQINAEHKIGCQRDPGEKEWSMTEAYWSYEHTDEDKPEICWECKAEVPTDIVGIVKMLNWSTL